MVRNLSIDQNFVWNTTGLVAGTYNIDVWMRQNGSSSTDEAFTVISFTLT